MTLPTLLASALPTDPGLRPPDDEGVSFEARLYTTSGLTSTYTRTLTAIYGSQVCSAAWRYDRVGGADHAEIVLQGGLDLSTGTLNQTEIQIERNGAVWYRGRVTAYEHFTTDTGEVRTRVWCEGYTTKLAEIRVSGTWSAGQTIKTVVQDLLDSYVTPASRITYAAGDIVAPYVLVGALRFEGTALAAMRMLALLQGSVEWGVSEGTPPHFFFVAESVATSNAAQVMMGRDVSTIGAAGGMQRAYNRVRVVGGLVGSSLIVGTSNDLVSQNAYGVRETTLYYPQIGHATDAQRIATNILAAQAAGESRISGVVLGPASRIESDRSDATVAITGTPKVTFHGVSGVQQAALPDRVTYRYQRGSPPAFTAEVWAGTPDETEDQVIRRIDRKVDALGPLIESVAAGIGSGTVTSVALTLPAEFAVSGSPVTGAGTLTGAWANQSANLVFAGPGAGPAAPPTFRSLVADDIPSLSAAKITSGTLAVARGGTGIGAGTDGGILGFTAAGTIASSALLGANALVIGGGAGATPSALAGLGTTTQLLHGNALGAPTWGALVAADLSDNLITYAKIQQVSATAKVLGRTSAGAGNVEEVGIGSAAGTVCAGNDARLSDARTPAAHATSHVTGADQLADMVGDAGAGGTHGLVPAPAAGDAAAGKFLKADKTWAVPPTGSLDIDGLTAADPALGDEVPIYDVSAAANRKITVEKLGLLLRFHVGGRLTLTSGTPVTTADVTAAGTLYYAIYEDDQIALYDGTRWKMYTFTERSLALTLTSGKNYDVFLYDNAGTLTLELSAAWTNDTTRADALARQDGVWVKSGAATRRWLGMIRASGTNQCEDSGYVTTPKRFVVNAYHAVMRPFKIIEATDSWTYAVNSWRAWDNSTANQFQFLSLGVNPVLVAFDAIATNDNSRGFSVGVGLDSTTVNSSGTYQYGNSTGGGITAMTSAQYYAVPALGYHYLQLLEISGSPGTTSFYGDAGATWVQSGAIGWCWG